MANDQIALVIEAIARAKEITPKGNDVRVYILEGTGLNRIYDQVLKDILLKLQDDEGIIKIKSFPEWWASEPLAKEILVSLLNVRQDPSTLYFTVETLNGFDEWCACHFTKKESLIKEQLPKQEGKVVPPSASASLQEYIFRKQGDYWNIRFEDKESSIKHSRGMDYIAHLLANPNKEIPVIDFTSSKIGGSPAPKTYQDMSVEELEKEGLSISGFDDGMEIWDEQAKSQFRERLHNIEIELAQAEKNNDPGQIESLKNEKYALAHELKAAIGLGGRDRKEGSVFEKARDAVRNSIHRATNHIGECDPKLAQFLDNSIQTGVTCIYRPDQDIPWKL